MSLPGRIKQIAKKVATDIFDSRGFMNVNQALNNLITSGTVTDLNGATAIVRLDNGAICTVSLSNNQYSFVGARVNVAGNSIVV